MSTGEDPLAGCRGIMYGLLLMLILTAVAVVCAWLGLVAH